MSNADELKKIQESLDKLLLLNTSLAQKVEKLEEENRQMKRSAADVEARIEANKDEWMKLHKEAVEIIGKMTNVKGDLTNDGVGEEFFSENTVVQRVVNGMLSDIFGESFLEPQVAVLKREEDVEEIPFENKGREERVEITFGQDSDYSPVTLRRFIERYRVVKDLNVRSRLEGWDKPEYRAGKLKLGLVGDPFDYITFESSMAQSWTNNDELIIEKLMDKYINIQAIEMNILKFENAE